MDLIKKILVAIDGSEHADKALDFALDLAEKYSATVTIINVFQVPRVIYPMVEYPGEPFAYPATWDEFTKEVKVAHEKILSNALKRAKDLKPNLKISNVLEEGRPADKIVETAKEGNFDLIVMGHRGLGRVKEFFLGSVADRVADEAHCPVIIVK
ncbi:MAG: universal stress protein [Candidatus Bathyarchaeia archaeon]